MRRKKGLIYGDPPYSIVLRKEAMTDQKPLTREEVRQCEIASQDGQTLDPEIAELLCADWLRMNEEPPLWIHALDECNEAHAELDRLGAPVTKSVRRIRGEGNQEITIGLAERIRAWKESMTDPKPITREETVQELIEFLNGQPLYEGGVWVHKEDWDRLCADWLRMEARIREMGEELSNCPERAHEEFFEEAEPPVKKEVDK